MALLGTQQFKPVKKADGTEATEVTELKSPDDLEVFVDDLKGLLDGITELIERDAKSDEPVLTDGQREIAWMVTGMYVQDAKRDGTKLIDSNNAPYAFWKHRCYRERNQNGEGFNPMTLATFRIRETRRGPTLAADSPLNYGGREVKAKKGGKK